MWHNIRHDVTNKFKISLLQMIWLSRLKAHNIFGLTSQPVPVKIHRSAGCVIIFCQEQTNWSVYIISFPNVDLRSNALNHHEIALCPAKLHRHFKHDNNVFKSHRNPIL